MALETLSNYSSSRSTPSKTRDKSLCRQTIIQGHWRVGCPLKRTRSPSEVSCPDPTASIGTSLCLDSRRRTRHSVRI